MAKLPEQTMKFKVNKARFKAKRAKRKLFAYLAYEIGELSEALAQDYIETVFLFRSRIRNFSFATLKIYLSLSYSMKTAGWLLASLPLPQTQKRIDMSKTEAATAKEVLAEGNDPNACVGYATKKMRQEIHREVMGTMMAFERQSLEGFATLFTKLGNADEATFDVAYRKHQLLLEDLRKNYVTYAARVIDKNLPDFPDDCCEGSGEAVSDEGEGSESAEGSGSEE